MTIAHDLRPVKQIDRLLTVPERTRNLQAARTVIRQPDATVEDLVTACAVLMHWGDWRDMQMAEQVMVRLDRPQREDAGAAGVILWIVIAILTAAVAGLWITEAISGAAFDAARPVHVEAL